MTQGVGNEPEGDSLQGKHRRWLRGVIPSFRAENQHMFWGCREKLLGKHSFAGRVDSLWQILAPDKRGNTSCRTMSSECSHRENKQKPNFVRVA